MFHCFINALICFNFFYWFVQLFLFFSFMTELDCHLLFSQVSFLLFLWFNCFTAFSFVESSKWQKKNNWVRRRIYFLMELVQKKKTIDESRCKKIDDRGTDRWMLFLEVRCPTLSLFFLKTKKTRELCKHLKNNTNEVKQTAKVPPPPSNLSRIFTDTLFCLKIVQGRLGL